MTKLTNIILQNIFKITQTCTGFVEILKRINKDCIIVRHFVKFKNFFNKFLKICKSFLKNSITSLEIFLNFLKTFLEFSLNFKKNLKIY